MTVGAGADLLRVPLAVDPPSSRELRPLFPRSFDTVASSAPLRAHCYRGVACASADLAGLDDLDRTRDNNTAALLLVTFAELAMCRIDA